MDAASILWRRLDTPGHDACRLDQSPAGWQLEGMALFRYHGAVAQLTYRVESDVAWRARQGQVYGWLGGDRVDLDIARTEAGAWIVNGVAVPHLEQCFDLDFGFTPATNLFPLRRLALDVGQAAGAPAAWLDLPAGTLTLLTQRYERRSETIYWYESLATGYAALLDVDPTGFVRRYPRLWEAES